MEKPQLTILILAIKWQHWYIQVTVSTESLNWVTLSEKSLSQLYRAEQQNLYISKDTLYFADFSANKKKVKEKKNNEQNEKVKERTRSQTMV